MGGGRNREKASENISDFLQEYEITMKWGTHKIKTLANISGSSGTAPGSRVNRGLNKGFYVLAFFFFLI